MMPAQRKPLSVSYIWDLGLIVNATAMAKKKVEGDRFMAGRRKAQGTFVGPRAGGSHGF